MSILINGSLFGYFSCQRGVRQGDPLSSILFCLVEEVLSRGISLLAVEGKIAPISHPRGLKAPTHLLYADDIFVFCKGTSSALHSLLNFLDHYGQASCQIVSKVKSRVFIGKGAVHQRHFISSVLGISEGSALFTYFGGPNF